MYPMKIRTIPVTSPDRCAQTCLVPVRMGWHVSVSRHTMLRRSARRDPLPSTVLPHEIRSSRACRCRAVHPHPYETTPGHPRASGTAPREASANHRDIARTRRPVSREIPRVGPRVSCHARQSQDAICRRHPGCEIRSSAERWSRYLTSPHLRYGVALARTTRTTPRRGADVWGREYPAHEYSRPQITCSGGGLVLNLKRRLLRWRRKAPLDPLCHLRHQHPVTESLPTLL